LALLIIQLQKYEKGTNRIAAGRLLLIAKALGKPVDYFYSEFDTSDSDAETDTTHQRMCIEVSRNFMKINNSNQQNAINALIRSLVK
jgi:transcriptional regulator with XRE-family HTH domain